MSSGVSGVTERGSSFVDAASRAVGISSCASDQKTKRSLIWAEKPPGGSILCEGAGDTVPAHDVQDGDGWQGGCAGMSVALTA